MPSVDALEHRILADILLQLEKNKKTGLLTITQGEKRSELYLEQGDLTYISPLNGNAALAEKLLEAKGISAEEVTEALRATSTQHGKGVTTTNPSEIQITRTLTERGILSREQLDAYIAEEATKILQDLLTWSAAEVYFDEETQKPTSRFRFRITSMIPSLADASSTLILPITENTNAAKSALPTLKIPVPQQTIPAPALPSTTGKARAFGQQVRLVSPLPAVFDWLTAVQETVKLPGHANSVLPLPINEFTTEIPVARKNSRNFLRWEVPLIIVILLIAALAHGINMYHFPYFEDDEGTYMSQAWAIVHEGRLAYYTYWYDHAPAGWIQIAAWTVITGGIHILGPASDSGRTFMLLLQIGSVFILYCIARSISKSVTVAVVVSLLFALSPYGIYFHRRILLDNITTFWMLLSILLLIPDRLSLKRAWLSAVALSLSILSKEVTVFLIPVMVFLVYCRADKSHRWIATIGWLTLVFCILSLYPLLATLKGELFPTGTLLGGTAPHVSLIGTLKFQASRGKDGGLLDFHSGFWIHTRTWMQDDPMLVIVGSICAILSVLAMKWHRLVGVMGLATLSLWVFLGRGGEVIGFYLVPLLPLLALNVGLILGLTYNWLKTVFRTPVGIAAVRVIQIILAGMCLSGMLVGYTTSPDLGFQSNHFLLWNTTQTDAQNQATQWVEEHLPRHSLLIIDEYMWTDLYDSGFTSAHYYWKVEEDPAIRGKIFHDDWRNVDYVITTPQLLGDAQNNNMTLVEDALEHSTLLIHFDSGGWPIDIRKVNK
jgi:hypothetical protein